MSRVLWIAPAVLLTAACAAPSRHWAAARTVAQVSPVAGGTTITATGQGQASGTPDLLTVVLGVSTTLPSANRALAVNNTEAQTVIGKLTADGVAAKDMQTSQLSLNPDYGPPTPVAPPKLTGYTVSDLLTIKLRDLAKAGTILDDAVAAGGNDAQVQSITYSVENAAALLQQARQQAVGNAKAEATAMAAAAGVSLGKLVLVTDVISNQVPTYGGIQSMAASGAGSTGAPPVPVQPGQQDYTVQVEVTYSAG